MHVTLTDMNPHLIDAMNRLIRSISLPPRIYLSGVEAVCGDIFTAPADAVVSPANSFGFMDGGIDAVYSRRWPHVQHAVRSQIQSTFDGELLVGQSLYVATQDIQFPYLIAAPTMRVPAPILSPNDVRLATRAAVRLAVRMGLSRLVIPGMGTLTGKVMPEPAARLMLAGILDGTRAAPVQFSSWQEAAQDQHTFAR